MNRELERRCLCVRTGEGNSGNEFVVMGGDKT